MEQIIKKENNSFFFSVFEKINKAVVITDERANILWCNSAFCSLSKYEMKEILGKNMRIFKSEYHDDSFYKKFWEKISGEGSFEGDMINLRGDGKYYWERVSIEAIYFNGIRYYIAIKQDITENKKIEFELKSLNMAISKANLPLFMAGIKGNIKYINKSFLKLFRYEKEEDLFGKNIWLCYKDKNKIKEIKEILHMNKFYSGEESVKDKDGKDLFLNISLSLVCDESNNEICILGTFLDITDEKNIKKELEENIKNLKIKNDQLTDFTYIASHDLREPLRKIVAFGDRLDIEIEKLNLDKNNKIFLYKEKMKNSAERMKRLIDGLLRYSRANTVEINIQEANLNDILKEILSDLELHIEKYNTSFVIQNLPILNVDSLLIKQALQNIIANAIKFSKMNSNPEVRIYSRETKTFYKIYIEDNGIGFEEGDINNLFKIFNRLHSAKDYYGTGVGLIISKKIIERHGGRIVPIPKKHDKDGAKFIIYLPK